MFQTSATDVISQISTVLSVLAPIYAIAFGILAAKALLGKGFKRIFPNYKPYGRSRPRSTSTAKRSKTTRPEGAIAPAKRPQRTTIFFDAAKAPEIKRINGDVYVSYTAPGGNRTTMYLKSTRGPVVKKTGGTVQVSYD